MHGDDVHVMARHVLLVDPDGTRVDHLASVLGRVAAAPAILTFAAVSDTSIVLSKNDLDVVHMSTPGDVWKESVVARVWLGGSGRA